MLVAFYRIVVDFSCHNIILLILLCFSEFSISDWYKNMSIPVGTLLLATQLSILKEALGITNFLLPKDQQCSRMSSDYKPETSGRIGWKIGKICTLPTCWNYT